MNIIKYILSDNINIDMIIKEIKDIKKLFMSANIEDISFGANISDYNKGVLIDSGSFVISKGCPIHVRAAGYYNYLLNKNYKYKNKYTIIKAKDKVKIIIIKIIFVMYLVFCLTIILMNLHLLLIMILNLEYLFWHLLIEY